MPLSARFALISLTVFGLFCMPGNAGPKTANTQSGNENVEIKATVYVDRNEIKQKLGADPGPGIVLVDVMVAPKSDQPLKIDPDDFVLLAHDDGQRSRPFAPSQLAGDGALVLKPRGINGVSTANRGPSYGGPWGRPRQLPGNNSGVGNSSVQEGVDSKMEKNETGDSELLAVLKKKVLPNKETKDELGGFLYFPLEGKHKLKNLAVLYRGPAGKLDLEFDKDK